ncbi:MAG: DUF4038 domain-containing protein [Thermoguttaceae bacterium]
MGVEKMKAQWRYLIARYGAWPVVWCAAGEANLPWYLAKSFPSDDRTQVHGWTEVLRFIRTTDTFRRPLSIHPTAINRYTSRHATDDETLLDFDLMQTPHGQREAVPVVVRAVRETFAAAPRMPVIDGEASYEMLSDKLPTQWTRAMFWLCLMNGAKGHTYGANGIWQLNRPGQPHGPSPTAGSPPNGYGVITWEDAMKLPGSTQVAHGKRFFELLPWTQLMPMPESVAWASGPAGNPLVAPQACGIEDKLRAIYVLEPRAIVIRRLKPGAAYRVTHFDPVTGESSPATATAADTKGEWRCEPPSHGHDWVLLLKRDETASSAPRRIFPAGCWLTGGPGPN